MEEIPLSDEEFIKYMKNMEEIISNLNLKTCLLKLKDDSFPNYERWKSYVLSDYYIYHNNITNTKDVKNYKSMVYRDFLLHWTRNTKILENQKESVIYSSFIQTARQCLVGAIINYFNRGAIIKVNDEKKEMLTRMDNKISFRDNLFGVETFVDINVKDIIDGIDLLGILILPNRTSYRDEDNNSEPQLISGEVSQEYKNKYKNISFYYFLKSNINDTFLNGNLSINFTYGLAKTEIHDIGIKEEDRELLKNKICTIVCNILDFINLPEVSIRRYSTREIGKIRKISQPDQIQIHLTGKLYRYVYEELPEMLKSVESGKIPYSHFIRGYYMHFWNKEYYKRIYSMTNEELEKGDYSINNGIIMKTVKPYIKGKGKLLEKSYQVGNENYWRNQNTMIMVLTELFPINKIAKNNRTILNGLELDGVVFNEKNEILFAFEYDGYQHFNFPNIFHETKQEFDEQVERDKLKDKMCKELGIKLIRIPYTIGGESERILSRKEILDFLKGKLS